MGANMTARLFLLLVCAVGLLLLIDAAAPHAGVAAVAAWFAHVPGNARA